MSSESDIARGQRYITSLMAEHNLEREDFPTRALLDATIELVKSYSGESTKPEQTHSTEFSFNQARYGLQLNRKTNEEKSNNNTTEQLTVFELGIFQLDGPDKLNPLSQTSGDHLQLFEQNQVVRMNLYLTYQKELASVATKRVSVEGGLLVHPHASSKGWGMGAALSGELITQTLIADFIREKYQLHSMTAYIKDESTNRHAYTDANPKRTAWSSRLAQLLGYTKVEGMEAYESILGATWWKYYYFP